MHQQVSCVKPKAAVHSLADDMALVAAPEEDMQKALEIADQTFSRLKLNLKPNQSHGGGGSRREA